jgi:hypothetical protein
MSNSPQRLREIIDSVELSGVRLRELVASGSPPKGKVPITSVDVGHSARVIDKTAEGFDVAAEVRVRAVSAAGPRSGGGSRRPLTMLSVRATFELHYRLPKIDQFSMRDLSRFSNVNGVYNAWPYWRELIQNVSVRMGLPPLILPVFRISRPRNQNGGLRTTSARQEKR